MEQPATFATWDLKVRAWHLAVLAALSVAAALSLVLPALSRPVWLGGLARQGLLFGPMVWGGCLLGYPVAMLALLVSCVLFRRLTRRQRLRRVVIAAVLAVAAVAAFHALSVARELRRDLIRQTPARMQPLVAALARYHAAHGAYPRSLQQLVPAYLPRLPRTGMIGYSVLRYKQIELEPEWRRRPSDSGRAYELIIPCSLGFVNWDSLHYWPSERYPRGKWGGEIERMDGWAYVHE